EQCFCEHISYDQLAAYRATESVCHPYIALTVDTKPAATPTSAELFCFARIRGGKTRYVTASGIRDPNPVLLINAQMERRPKRFSRLYVTPLAQNLALGQIPFGEMKELRFA